MIANCSTLTTPLYIVYWQGAEIYRCDSLATAEAVLRLHERCLEPAVHPSPDNRA